MSDVRDEYIEEAACWKNAKAQRVHIKTHHFPQMLRFAVAAAACAVLVFVGVKILKPNPQVPSEPLLMDVSNPIEEVSSMTEAKAIVGFNLVYEGMDSRYIKQSIVIYDRTILEVSFASQNDLNAGFSIRKAKTTEDISGDYTDYNVTRTVAHANFDVMLKGEDEEWCLAMWQKNGYTYAISVQGQPMSTEEIIAIITDVD